MKKLFTLLSLVFLPTSALAATDFGSVKTLIDNFTTNVVTSLGYLMMTLAVVVFFWGIVEFIWASREGKVEEKTKGKAMMTWGLVALFVMFSVWGIITFAQKMLGPDFTQTTIKIPKLEFNGAGGGTPADSPLNGDAACGAGSNCKGCGNGRTCMDGSCVMSSTLGDQCAP